MFNERLSRLWGQRVPFAVAGGSSERIYLWTDNSVDEAWVSSKVLAHPSTKLRRLSIHNARIRCPPHVQVVMLVFEACWEQCGVTCKVRNRCGASPQTS